MRRPTLLLLLASCAVETARAEDAADLPASPLLAILEFENHLPQDERGQVQAIYFADVVRARAAALLPAARVMTHENISAMLAATGRSLTDCEGTCEVETAKALGADLIVAGDFSRSGPLIRLRLRLIAVASGHLLADSSADGETAEELDRVLPRSCESLFKPLAASVGGNALGPQLSFRSESAGNFFIRVEGKTAAWACQGVTTLQNPCLLSLPEPGEFYAFVGGDANLKARMLVSEQGARFKLAHHGYALTVLGLSAVLVGSGAGTLATVQIAGQQSGFEKVQALGFGVAAAGAILLVVDLARGPHGWHVSVDR